jgi:5-hydroxyisourate hydrolase-like protein (transthyretin family)
MNRKQLNQQAMLESVAAFLGLRASDLAINPVIANNTAILNAILKTIRDLKQIQDKTTKGATRTKNDIVNMMKDGILKVGAALCAYATDVKDYDLLAKASFTDTAIKQMRQSDLADKARTIYEAAEPVVLHLGVHQVKEEDITALKDNYDAIMVALPGGRGVKGQTKQSTADIQAKIDEAKLLLKEKIDVHIRPYKSSNPTLFGEYMNARIIVDIAATHATKGDVMVKVLDEVTGKPVANAEANAKKKGGTEMTKTVKRTETDGMAPFPPLDPGEYSYEVAVDGYVTATGTFVVEAGKLIVVEVRLRRS